MIGDYLTRLLIMLPLIGGLAFAVLWLWRRGGGALSLGGAGRARAKLAITDTMPLGPLGKLALVRFGDRELLVAVTKNGTELLAHRRTPADA